MKTKHITLVAFALLSGLLPAQSFQNGGGVMIGGGYLEEPENVYGFAQFRLNFYEDDQFTHTAFLEISGHEDDATLFFADRFGNVFREDGDVTFVGITANYEMSVKLGGPFSIYGGGGAGVEVISLDDRFDDEVDSDTNFMGQVFAGLRASFDNGFTAQAGVRYLFREDFSLLDDQFVTENTLGYEIGVGFKF